MTIRPFLFLFLDYFHLTADAVRKCKLFGPRLEWQLRFVRVIRQALELDGQIFHFTQAAGVFVPNPLLLARLEGGSTLCWKGLEP